MKVNLTRYPGGKKKALTMSYDDGAVYDIRLVEIFNKYGFKGSFHLNSGFFGDDTHIKADDVRSLYEGHEVSVHTVTHPSLTALPDQHVFTQAFEDRRTLEALCGYVVRGMSYPHGAYNDNVMRILKSAGIVCSRTTVATNSFALPNDFLAWHPTCHHNDDLDGLLDTFINYKFLPPLAVFFIWGHSHEFNRNNNWEIIENFCSKAQSLDDVWYATNIEIYDYVQAVRSIVLSADDSIAFNPSNTTVFAEVNGEIVKLEPGTTKF